MADHAHKQRTAAKHEGKKPVTTVSEIVDFNEKSVLEDIKDDIQRGVAHPINELEQHVNDLDDSWETESMLADMLEGLAEDEHTNGMFTLHTSNFSSSSSFFSLSSSVVPEMEDFIHVSNFMAKCTQPSPAQPLMYLSRSKFLFARGGCRPPSTAACVGPRGILSSYY